ncbi:MAG: acyltransferase family protein [Pseudomonadota bacterium]
MAIQDGQVASMTDQSTARYHGLDALRAFAMFLGVVLHSALIYVEPVVMAELLPETAPVEPSLGVSILSLWIHLWRMPLFFLLAGFFAEMALHRRGAGPFLYDRLIRILGTLVFFLAVFALMTGQDFGTLDHLWFLWFLWWYCVAAGGLHRLGWGRHLSALEWFFAQRSRVLWLIVPVAVMSLLLRENTVVQIIPIVLWDPAWQGFVFNILFFFAGQALWRNRARLPEILRPMPSLCALGAGSVATLLLIFFGAAVETETAPFGLFIVAAPVAAIGTLGTSFGLIGLTQSFVLRGSRLLSGLVRLAYPVYVFHLYIAIAISVAIYAADPQIPQGQNVAITTVATSLACALLYLVMVRFTPLEWLFAGWKNAWWQWPFGEKKAAQTDGLRSRDGAGG